MLPLAFTVIVIALFLAIINSVKGVFLEKSVSDIVFFACIGGIIIILLSQIIIIYSSIKTAIENLSKLNEIISPIILV